MQGGNSPTSGRWASQPQLQMCEGVLVAGRESGRAGSRAVRGIASPACASHVRLCFEANLAAQALNVCSPACSLAAGSKRRGRACGMAVLGLSCS